MEPVKIEESWTFPFQFQFVWTKQFYYSTHYTFVCMYAVSSLDFQRHPQTSEWRKKNSRTDRRNNLFDFLVVNSSHIFPPLSLFARLKAGVSLHCQFYGHTIGIGIFIINFLSFNYWYGWADTTIESFSGKKTCLMCVAHVCRIVFVQLCMWVRANFGSFWKKSNSMTPAQNEQNIALWMQPYKIAKGSTSYSIFLTHVQEPIHTHTHTDREQKKLYFIPSIKWFH